MSEHFFDQSSSYRKYFQLENNTVSFDALSKFANEDIHLKLVGDAQYLNHFPTEFCNENVDKYYHLDKTLTVN